MADQVRLDRVGDLITSLTTEHVTAFMSAEGESGHATVMKIIEAVLDYVGRPITLARPDPSWDASGGAFPASATAGNLYITTVSGTVGGVTFEVNDQLLCLEDDASTSVYAANWLKLDYTDQVLSVAGLTGAIDAGALRGALSIKPIAVTGSASDLSAGTVADERLPPRIGVYAVVTGDWDAALQIGSYYSSPGSGKHAPNDTDWFYGSVSSGGNNQDTTQIVRSYVTASSSDTKTYCRLRRSGVWGDWFSLRISEDEQAALWTSIVDLASTDEGKGAALVGIEAITGLPGVTSVQTALEMMATEGGAVGAAIAALPFGDVGTVAMVKITGGPNPGAGGNVDGQYVVYSGLSASTGDAAPVGSTWQLMGAISGTGGSSGSVTLAKRVE